MGISIHKDIPSSTVSLRYKGRISFDLIDSILLLLQARLDEVEEDVSVRKSVYGIAMECAQNLCIHAEIAPVPVNYDANAVLISIQTKSDGYKIITGNYIQNERINELKSILDEVNSKRSSGELRELYNKVLTNNNYSSKGGGGLGLIDIARKSSEKLNYSFERLDNMYSYFKLKVRIKKKVAA